MTTNSKSDIDSRTRFILEKFREEYEVIKRQGFPALKGSSQSQYARKHDAMIPENRWHSWASELRIDYVQLEAILKILENDGFLEKFQFIPDYV